MNSDKAERWVVISALIVAGVYAYRRLTEPVAKPPIKAGNLTGQGAPPPLGTFATAWGVTFLGVSVMASADAGLGGAFALLIATADLLANMPALTKDIADRAKPPAPVKDTSTAPAPSVSAPGRNMFTAPFSTFPTVPDPFYVAPPPSAAHAR